MRIFFGMHLVRDLAYTRSIDIFHSLVITQVRSSTHRGQRPCQLSLCSIWLFQDAPPWKSPRFIRLFVSGEVFLLSADLLYEIVYPPASIVCIVSPLVHCNADVEHTEEIFSQLSGEYRPLSISHDIVLSLA